MKYNIHSCIIVILLILLVATCVECSGRGKIAAANLNSMTDTLKYYENSLGTITASKATMLVNNSQLKKIIEAKDKELLILTKQFSRINTVVKADIEFRTDTLKIPYAVEVPCNFKRVGEIKNKWYGFNYNSDEKGFSIDSLIVPLSVSIITGKKRKWFLGKEIRATEITVDNPYVKVSDFIAAEVIVEVPWYRKWYVWTAIGIAGGIFIAK
jgi:hypothetical protein